MYNSVSLTKLAAVVIAAAILLVFSFNLYVSTMSNEQSHYIRLTKILQNRSGPDFEEYDGSSVDGEYVRSCMKKYGGDYFIRIRTQKNPRSFCVLDQPVNNKIIWEEDIRSGGVQDVTSPSSKCYVPGNEMFKVTILKEDGDVIGVSFEQENVGLDYDDSNHKSILQNATSYVKSTGNLNAMISTVRQNIADLQQQNRNLDEESNLEVTENSRRALNQYSAAYKTYKRNVNAAETAWQNLENVCKDTSGVLNVWGRVAIDPGATSGATNSLDYYNSLFAAERGE